MLLLELTVKELLVLAKAKRTSRAGMEPLDQPKNERLKLKA